MPGKTVQLTIDAGLQEYAARRLGTNSGSAVVHRLPDRRHAGDGVDAGLRSQQLFRRHQPSRMEDAVRRRSCAADEQGAAGAVSAGLDGQADERAGAARGGRRSRRDASIAPARCASATASSTAGSAAATAPSTCTAAIAQSCDIYFYEMARRLGYDAIAPVARALGLGAEIRPALLQPALRHRARPAWKLQRYKQHWTVADTLNASIGQGYVLANPLQLAVMAARIASGQALHAQHPDRQRSAPRRAARRSRPSISRSSATRCRAWSTAAAPAARRGCRSPASRWPARPAPRRSAASPWPSARAACSSNASLPFKLRDHALFICFAPADNPRYAAAVVLEHDGHTVRNLDTPMIGRDIMTYLFDRDRAMKSLAEVEPTWGGDIRTRMAAEAAAYRAAANAPPPAAQRNRDRRDRADRRRRSRGGDQRGRCQRRALANADRAGDGVAATARRRPTMSGLDFVPAPLAQLPWKIILLVLAIGCSACSCSIRRPAAASSPGRCRRASASSSSSAVAIVLSRVPGAVWSTVAFPPMACCWSLLVLVELLGAVARRQPALARPRLHPPPAVRTDEAGDRAGARAILRHAAARRDATLRRDLAGAGC